jgi:hypothetical protein
MDNQGPGRGKRQSENDLPSLRLAGLPPRPKAVLEHILGAASAILEQGIAATLNEAEQQLFKLAEQARSNEHQNRCFEALREIRRGRSDVAPRFVIRLEAALATIDKAHSAPGFSRVNRGQRSELVLVDENEFEESLALQEVASKCEIRNSMPLFSLGQRFGVLAGSKAFEPDELPVGPHRICDCLRDAVGCFDLALEFRIVLYRAFDRACSASLTKVFEAVNQVCVEQRILPNLILSPVRGKGAGGGVGGGKPAGEPADPKNKQPPEGSTAETQGPGFAGPGYAGSSPGYMGGSSQGNPAGGAQGMSAGGPAGFAGAGPQRAGGYPGAAQQETGSGGVQRRVGDPGRAGNGPAGSAAQGAPPAGAGFGAAVQMPDLSDIPGAAGFANPMTGWPGAGPTGGRQDFAPDPRDVELFETMRDLMAGRRHALGMDSRVAPEQAHAVRAEDVQSVLGALQSKPAAPIRAGGKVINRSIGHIKQDLLNQLRQLAPDNKTPQLEEVDNDTIDLVGMLFEHLGKDAKPTGTVQDFLTRLQVPLLRVALKDKSFFTRRSHPARQLLNSVAEAGLFWFDDEGEDRQLVEKMRLVVDRVTAEYDGDLGVFDELLTDLSKHLSTVSRKSEVAERRHVDAAKGRERLDLARSAATRAIAERIADRKPPPLIRTLLEQAWTDVLALTILRQGENSDAYRKRLEIADQLIEALDGGAVRADEPAGRALRQEVETGLTQVGYHGDDINAVVTRLFGGEAKAANDEDPASMTELAIKLKARSRLGAEADAETEATKAAASKPRDTTPLNSEEQRVLERLRTVPFGTWFAFTTNQQGETVRRKLSWFSTMTGRCLFVNQRGVRSEEKSLEQLAREIVRGQATVVEAQKETLIDRAWGAIVNTLKQFAGKLPTPAAAPG